MNLSAWRLLKTKYAGNPLDGAGAQTFGGRWNSVGTAIVYCSSSAGLAALEVLTHLSASTQMSFQLIEFRFEEKWVNSLPLNAYPRNWNCIAPSSPLTQRLGDRWVRSETSAVLRVSSVHVPLGDSYLFNPGHRHFNQIETISRKAFSFDRRLIQVVQDT